MDEQTIGRRAFEFIDELKSRSSPRDIVDHLGSVLRDFGFNAFLVTGLPNPGDRIEPLVLLNGWNREWYRLYTQRNYVQDDPVVAHCFRSIDPFEWSEAPFNAERTPRSLEIMERAEDFGMKRGFCVPIHTADGFESVVTMAGEQPELIGWAKPAIHLMAVYTHSRARQVVAAPQRARRPRLSPRERDCLNYAAHGLTSEEIAGKLGITTRTVNAHFISACRKLAVVNRTAAVANALVSGEITL